MRLDPNLSKRAANSNGGKSVSGKGLRGVLPFYHRVTTSTNRSTAVAETRGLIDARDDDVLNTYLIASLITTRISQLLMVIVAG